MSFAVSPRVLKYLAEAAIEGDAELAQYARLLSEQRESKEEAFISLQHVQRLSERYRRLHPDRDDDGFVHQILRGSRLYCEPPPAPRERDPEFARRLERLRRQQEEREYADMTKDLRSRDRIRFVEAGEDAISVKNELGFGYNVIMLMVTGLVLGYVAARAVTDNQIVQVGVGLLGMFAAMLMETVLFVIREERKDKVLKQLRESKKKA